MHLPKLQRGMRPSVPHVPHNEHNFQESGEKLDKMIGRPPRAMGKVANKIKRMRGF